MPSNSVILISTDSAMKAPVIAWAATQTGLTFAGMVPGLEAAFLIGNRTTVGVAIIDAATADRVCKVSYLRLRSYLPDASLVVYVNQPRNPRPLAVVLTDLSTLVQTPAYLKAVEADTTTTSAVSLMDKLTSGEQIIVPYIVEGLTNANIGTNVGLSTKTIKNRMSLILNKLHLHNRTQLAIWARNQEANEAGQQK